MKKLRSMLSVLLALVMAVSMLTVMFVTTASASDTTEADKALAATRYRYPILRFENAKFPTGVAVDDNMNTSAYLATDGGSSMNGTDSMDLYFARVDEYDMFNMKLGKNRALRITLSDQTSNVVTEKYCGYVIHTGEEVGTSTQILPNDIQGIPEDATDHGVMFHIEIKGLPGKEADGFTYASFDAETKEITGYKHHVARDLNVTFQEWDYRENGKVVKKAGEEQATAMNVKAGGEMILIWTKDVSYTNTTGETEQAREPNGMPLKDENGNYYYVPVPDYSYKAGDVTVWKTYEYEYNGTKKEGGTINLPRDFCGYVIIPFSSFQRCWNANNVDGHLNFKNLNLANLHLSHYWYHQGEYIIDEYCFYGPTFAKANGAYDYGDINFANHKDSLVNRKEIEIEYEKEEESSLAPPPPVIETAVTLKNNGVTLNAPATAGLKADTKFHADVVDPSASEYTTAVYSKLFGDDATAYKSYSVYLGDEGEIEPTDYCELILPIPDGMNASDVKVYVIEGGDLTSSEKKAVDFELSDDKKSVVLKTVEMRAYIIVNSKAAGGTEEPGSSAEDGSTSTEDGSTTPDTSTGTPDSSTGTTDTSTGTTDTDDEKTSVGTTDTDNEKGSSAWIWIVVGAVVVVGAAAAVIVLTRKKPAEEDGEAEEVADDQPEA
ncbi:MAG: hypothetical protein IJC85_04205 [Oscillospiraceae bacterium]|nr:hypothetical protein [Oscillospiraceae bacterium]